MLLELYLKIDVYMFFHEYGYPIRKYYMPNIPVRTCGMHGVIVITIFMDGICIPIIQIVKTWFHPLNIIFNNTLGFQTSNVAVVF